MNTHWKTPKYFYDKLDKKYHFYFDPCPLHHDLNLWDGLKVEWGKRNYVNPPWDRETKEKFILKAVEEYKKGKLCVLLLPVSTSTEIFHDIILKYGKVEFIKRRIRFEGENTLGQYVTQSTGRKDQMIVIFKPNIFKILFK